MESIEDIVREILLRLPSKSIYEFTCASQGWKKIITDPLFSKQYFERTRRSLGCSDPRGRLFGCMQCLKKDGYIIHDPVDVIQRFRVVCSEKYHPGFKFVKGYALCPPNSGYFLTTSKDGLFLNGKMPNEYYVCNPISGKFESLPPPLPHQFYPQRALSVGLSSNDEDGAINFRVVIATGCDEQHEITGTKVIPVETYSSRTREWRQLELVSDIPIAIQNAVPPTVSGGFFHWFTATKRYIVAYDSSILDDDDNGLKLIKEHLLEVVEVPNATASQIIWRSDNGQTMLFGSSNAIDGVEVYRRRDGRDGWALIHKVQLNTVKYEIMGITDEDEKNEKKSVLSRRHVETLDMKTVSLDMVWMIAFMPWNPKLVIVRIWERFFIYDYINQKMHCEIEFNTPRRRCFITDGRWEWHPCFFSPSLFTLKSELSSDHLCSV